VEISSSFVFHFLSLFPQVFQMPFLASIKVYSSLSALLSLSLSLPPHPLQRPYMEISHAKHITTLGTNSRVSTRHKMNNINLRVYFLSGTQDSDWRHRAMPTRISKQLIHKFLRTA
jgi:hypothetical protein